MAVQSPEERHSPLVGGDRGGQSEAPRLEANDDLVEFEQRVLERRRFVGGGRGDRRPALTGITVGVHRW